MITSSTLLHQNDLFVAPEIPIQIREVNFGLQEFLTPRKCRNLVEFKQIHAQIFKLGLHMDTHSAMDLVFVCALSDWGCMDYACSIFHQIDEPNSFSYNTLIRGYVKDRNLNAAMPFYREMLEREVEPDNFTYPLLLKGCSEVSALVEGIQIHGHVFKFGFHSDIYVQNSLLSMYGRSREISHSLKVFDEMPEKSVASWSALISAHTSLGLHIDCLRLVRQMSREGWMPEESTLVSVLSSCTHLGALDLGRSAHGLLVRSLKALNVTIETALIDMYVKCGSLEQGLRVFYNMARRNVLSYSVMISGLAMHGEGERALWVFSDMLMEGLKPDEIVYVGILSACSHAGLVDEGLKAFDRMRFEHGLEPTIQHYGCMVDLLGRAGRLHQVYDLIRGIPFQPNAVVWRCLLGACKIHGNLELGEQAQKNLLQLDPQNSGDYIILSNIYARSQHWGNVARVRAEMMQSGSLQEPGFSIVEVRRKVHKFVSQDKSHPRSVEIYKMLHQMGWQLRFDGYRPDTSQVLFDVDEEEKKRLLSAHSQKLALAFGLICTHGSPIRIVKNLRMCDDCHTYTKYISNIYEREIIVRERNRFHHFREGRCSCGDYW